VFTKDNPDIMLPVDLDISSSFTDGNLVGPKGHNELPLKVTSTELTSDEFPSLIPDDRVLDGIEQSSPECSMKEPNSSDLWTEVVRKRKKEG
jgi:hypothetical protein